MKNKMTMIFTILCAFVSGVAIADKPSDSVYIDAGDSKTALILAHGKGKHPTWKVVDPLRKGVSEQMSIHTLSLQMPSKDQYWEDYANDFPTAYETIKKAIQFLKEERGVTQIFLMGHSMGSRMASAFVAAYPEEELAGLIIAGCRNNGDTPLSCSENVATLKLPVLDIWGGDNNKDVYAASDRKEFLTSNYKQVEISGANHKFDGYESEFVTAVVNWLKAQKTISSPTSPGIIR